MMILRDIETDRFNCTDTERAAFEAGIKLASLYHQFIGTPVGPENRHSLETAMEQAMRTQPHVMEAKVVIDQEVLSGEMGEMGYVSLNEKMISAMVAVRVKDTICTGRMEYISELEYPLMWVESMERKDP
jgi:hypothetical protein